MPKYTKSVDRQRRAEKEFEQNVWYWLGPLVEGLLWGAASEVSQKVIEKTTGKKLSPLARITANVAAISAGWLRNAGSRPTPDEKRRDFEKARLARGANWKNDLIKIEGIALNQSQIAALAFFGLPPEAVELSSDELEEVISKRERSIRLESTGGKQHVLLAGYRGYAETLRGMLNNRSVRAW